MLKPFSPRSFSHFITLGLCLFFGLLALQYFAKISHNPNRSAFLRWSNQIHDLWRGENIWHKHNYPNPPIMALMLVPLAHLPHVVGAMGWFFFKVGCAGAAIHWVWRMLDRPEHPFPPWAKLVALVLVLKPMEGDLIHGNVNLFILFLVAGSLYAFTRTRDDISGLLLGLAIACKLTPVLFLPYLAGKKAWKALAFCGVGLGLFLVLVPGLVFGMDNNRQFLGSWVQNMILPYVAHHQVTTEHQNQSLPGLLHRLLTKSPSFSERTEVAYIPLEYHNFLDLDPGQVQGIIKGCFFFFVLVVLWVCRTPTSDRQDWRLVAEFSLIFLGMLLFSERTWKHHCVTLLFPCAVLAKGLANSECSPRRRLLLGSLLGAGMLMWLTSTGLFPGQDRLGDLAEVYGAYVGAFVFLGLPLVVLLRDKKVPETQVELFQARISVTTEAPGTSGNGLPMRSISSVSGSIPSK
jgi:alpha-1,2-mannosyltransferase